MSKALWKFSRLVSLAAVVSSASLAGHFFLYGTKANPNNLLIDRTAPTGSTAKYRDLAAVNFKGGNPWKEIGWWTATPANSSGRSTRSALSRAGLAFRIAQSRRRCLFLPSHSTAPAISVMRL